MAMHLRSKAGDVFKVSGAHWAVYLALAGTFGWEPKGSQRPLALAAEESWSGQYDSSDGQFVTDEDSLSLARALHGAAVYPEISSALTDVIAHIESSVEALGHHIPAQMRMRPEEFFNEFSPLLLVLYKGGFYVE